MTRFQNRLIKPKLKSFIFYILIYREWRFKMEEYKEKIVFKIGQSKYGEYADLVVSEKNSKIVHWFDGPDRRYNTRGFVISGDDLDNYINAWRNSFKKMNLIKNELTNLNSGKYTTKGDKGLIISIVGNGGYVALWHYYWDRFQVSTLEDLNEVISKYEYAKNRIVEIQKMLRQI